MAHDLPAPVRLWLADQIRGRRLAVLKREHEDVSAGYRAGATSSGVLASDEAILSYALARMPATFAAASAALAALSRALPGLDPRSVLDIGCGPGTALVAAAEAFPRLDDLTGVDHNAPLLTFAGRIIGATGSGAGRKTTFLTGDLGGAFNGAPSDLVICSYALVELAEAAALSAVRRAWSLAKGALVLVEPGSRAGFARIRAARTALAAGGATILAPCTHQAPCPMAEPDWCHFSIRLARSREHRLLKGGDAPFEDEKFSYLVAARAPADQPDAGRIIAPPYHGKGESRFSLCTAAGLESRTVPSRAPAARQARKLGWGDRFAL